MPSIFDEQPKRSEEPARDWHETQGEQQGEARARLDEFVELMRTQQVKPIEVVALTEELRWSKGAFGLGGRHVQTYLYSRVGPGWELGRGRHIIPGVGVVVTPPRQTFGVGNSVLPRNSWETSIPIPGRVTRKDGKNEAVLWTDSLDELVSRANFLRVHNYNTSGQVDPNGQVIGRPYLFPDMGLPDHVRDDFTIIDWTRHARHDMHLAVEKGISAAREYYSAGAGIPNAEQLSHIARRNMRR